MASQAIVHVVRGGGARTVSRICSQFKYLARKGQVKLRFGERYGGGVVPFEELRIWAERWAAMAGVRDPNQDMTTHIVASFPPGTDHGAAERAGIAWAAEMFDDGAAGGERSYILGFHVDKGHPHVHVILNRRALSPGHEWLKLSNRNERINYDFMRQRFADHAQSQGIDLLADARVPIPWGSQPFTREEYEVFADAADVGVGLHEEWEDSTEVVSRENAARHQQTGGGPGSSGGDGPGAGTDPDEGQSRRKRPREEAPDDAALPSPKRVRTGTPASGSHHSGSGDGSGSQDNSIGNESSPQRSGGRTPSRAERTPSEDLYSVTPRETSEIRSEGQPIPGHAATGGPAGGGGSQSPENTVGDGSEGHSPRPEAQLRKETATPVGPAAEDNRDSQVADDRAARQTERSTRVETEEERETRLAAARARRRGDDLVRVVLTRAQAAEEGPIAGRTRGVKRKRENDRYEKTLSKRDRDGRS